MEQPAITRTCQILRAELLPYYYIARVLIDVDDLGSRSNLVGKWLRAIGPENRKFVDVRVARWGHELWHTWFPPGTHQATEKSLKKHWKVDLRVELLQSDPEWYGDVVWL